MPVTLQQSAVHVVDATLRRAAGLPEPRGYQGCHVINWPKEFNDLFQTAIAAINACSSAADLSGIPILLERSRARWFPWRRVPSAVMDGLKRALSDNPNWKFSGPPHGKADVIEIRAGTRVLIGAPSEPLNPRTTDQIADAVARLPEILEAHLPQCYIREIMRKSAQVLVIVVPDERASGSATVVLRHNLSMLIAPGMHLDIWPVLPNNSLLATIRSVGCEIYRSQEK
jgi:hypothetical protein